SQPALNTVLLFPASEAQYSGETILPARQLDRRGPTSLRVSQQGLTITSPSESQMTTLPIALRSPGRISSCRLLILGLPLGRSQGSRHQFQIRVRTTRFGLLGKPHFLAGRQLL